MSRIRCCVPGCVESGNSHKVLHGFPNPEKFPDLFRSWVYAVGGDILGLSNEYIYKQRRVCHAHFEDKHCCWNNRISKNAVPLINIPGPLSLSRFTFTERRPLQATHNILFDAPSTSKGPAIFDTEMRSSEVLSRNLNTKNMECEEEFKENSNPIPVTGTEDIPQSTARPNRPDFLPPQAPSNSKAALRPSAQKKTRRITKPEQKLYKKLVSLRVRLSKCRQKVKKQKLALQSAKKILDNPELHKIMDSWTIPAKILTLIQFREYKKKSKGRRFSTDDKVTALTLFKQSPRGYKLLRKMFILPSAQTLLRMLKKCSLTAGINQNVMSQLKTRAEKMKPEHKICSLIFDEMQLKANITYNERKDKVSGFVSDGLETKKVLADHAQAFMIRGLVKNFKQPVAYTFSAGATKGVELAKQLKEIIKQLQEVGFSIIATVCDQGTNNRQAIKLLKEETRREYLRKNQNPNDIIFKINGKAVVPIFDPPHLIKCIRNNLLTKDLEYKMDGKIRTAKWEHLQLLYKENPGYKGLRLMPKLTEIHVEPRKIAKMKVKYATQVFSRSVSSTMGYLSEKGILPQECKETADFLYFMDNLFDSVKTPYAFNSRISQNS